MKNKSNELTEKQKEVFYKAFEYYSTFIRKNTKNTKNIQNSNCLFFNKTEISKIIIDKESGIIECAIGDSNPYTDVVIINFDTKYSWYDQDQKKGISVPELKSLMSKFQICSYTKTDQVAIKNKSLFKEL